MALPTTSQAVVIGQDQIISLPAASFLVATDSAYAPYVEAFNYFFTLEILVGMLSVWLKLVIKPFKMQKNNMVIEPSYLFFLFGFSGIVSGALIAFAMR